MARQHARSAAACREPEAGCGGPGSRAIEITLRTNCRIDYIDRMDLDTCELLGTNAMIGLEMRPPESLDAGPWA